MATAGCLYTNPAFSTLCVKQDEICRLQTHKSSCERHYACKGWEVRDPAINISTFPVTASSQADQQQFDMYFETATGCRNFCWARRINRVPPLLPVGLPTKIVYLNEKYCCWLYGYLKTLFQLVRLYTGCMRDNFERWILKGYAYKINPTTMELAWRIWGNPQKPIRIACTRPGFEPMHASQKADSQSITLSMKTIRWCFNNRLKLTERGMRMYCN
jgi:hypothetical protein